MIFFTSDTHYGHNNIIKFCNRPFSSVEEMDAEMIKRFNERVKYNDTVYHLGDFTLDGYKTFKRVMDQLRIKQIIIMGYDFHHDKRWLGTFYTSAWTKFIPGKMIIVDNFNTNKHFVLCHFPFESWDRMHYKSIHLHGHSHNTLRKLPHRYDVGVDSWDFYPVSLDEILTLDSLEV